MPDNPLGKRTEYPTEYDPGLLFPIERSINRAKAGIDASAFSGYDAWNSHEFSWLTRKGKPVARKLSIVYPSDTPRIVESKSLKLYLNSFMMERFDGEEDVRSAVERDLSAAVDPDGNRVRVRVLDMGSARAPLVIPRRSSVDELDVSCDEYDVRPSLLSSRDIGKIRAQELYSDLLKANCPITGQPDWATVAVRVRSRRELSRESFLRYIVSYREHGDYHEACCEQILTHLASELKPEWLSVKCFFTRRGGIDINPARFIGCAPDADYGARYWRQ